ncbi:MAG: hypothetical protein C0391_03835 [Anaerolinea sp.]|nr:hypothetical protein [Anaerolinea sp.]
MKKVIHNVRLDENTEVEFECDERITHAVFMQSPYGHQWSRRLFKSLDDAEKFIDELHHTRQLMPHYIIWELRKGKLNELDEFLIKHFRRPMLMNDEAKRLMYEDTKNIKAAAATFYDCLVRRKEAGMSILPSEEKAMKEYEEWRK